jgi:hypothetical protein
MKQVFFPFRLAAQNQSEMSKLSKNQFNRFCSLLTILIGNDPKEDIKNKLLQDDYYNNNNLTDKGKNELRRLATIAGLISDKVFDDIRARKQLSQITEAKK